jgi:hypothetical protein
MSVINRKPFIQSVIDTLSDEQLESFANLLNGAESTIFRSFLNNSYPFSTDDKGVNHCVLEAKDQVFTGYLIYNDVYCVLIAYQEKSQALKILKIDYAHDKYTIVDEELSIAELRRIVEDNTVVAQIGDVEQSLVGKYVKIIQAPTSTTLTDDIIAEFCKGCIINGSFLGFDNPIIMPAKETTIYYLGILIAGHEMTAYRITKETKVIEKQLYSRVYALNSVGYINGKLIPGYPSPTGTFVLKCVNGTLTWVAEE